MADSNWVATSSTGQRLLAWAAATAVPRSSRPGNWRDEEAAEDDESPGRPARGSAGKLHGGPGAGLVEGDVADDAARAHGDPRREHVRAGEEVGGPGRVAVRHAHG